MIPLKLHIKNFLSYGPQTQIIDFEPYHLICLSGKNGHGKSALLDAITWALWGQARKVSGIAKADAQLLHLGQQHMMVLFDFSVNGHTYRIKREYAKSYGKSGSTLDFGIIDQATGTLNPLTTTAVRTTQEKIEDTVGLSYDCFINTAFLRQGASNEFSKKSPKDRKEVLSSILGLHHYETLRKGAVEKIKIFQTEIHTLSMLQEKLKLQAEPLESLTTQLASLKHELDALSHEQHQVSLEQTQITTQHKDIAQHLATLHNTLELTNDKLQHLIAARTQLSRQITAWRLAVAQARHAGSHNVLSVDNSEQLISMNIRAQEAQQAQQNLANAQHHLTSLSARLNLEYQKQLHTAELALQQCNAQLQTCNQQDKEIKRVLDHEAAQSQQHAHALRLLEQQMTELAVQDYEALKRDFEKYKYYFHQWTSYANTLSSQLKFQEKSLLALSAAQATCPVCEQSLAEATRAQTYKKITELTRLLNHQLARLRTLLPTLKELLIKKNVVLEHIDKESKERIRLEVLIAEQRKKHATSLTILTAYQKSYQDNQITLVKLQQQLDNVQHDYQALKAAHPLGQDSNNEELKSCQQEISRLENVLSAIGYNAQEHHALLQAQQAYETHSKNSMHNDYELKAYPIKRREFLEAIKILARPSDLGDAIKNLQQQIDRAQSMHKDIQQKISMSQVNSDTLRSKKETILEQRGKLSQCQQHATKSKEEFEHNEVHLASLRLQLADLDVINTALSKDGIQALFIEDAIPMLELEANNLLGQLTDNQAHIFIDSLRDLKNGGTKETLDIKISDAQGIRPYELFSGGEAFRIDFALRIAISRLLAGRSGTALQTLIIDEGFGSQDEEGLANIMEALYRIQNNFCKIIIVSHLPSMKEQFPVHFAISKESQGSVVRVIQQG